ncbi:glycosyl hydrolase family 76-domain-containing protein [Lasiosphaeria miniovina]|uniref:Mannan endo-1,6-alpha-mannosidase n=1 Tax=Lasiosphaeria miniovina TaxID=1954250 RepID=A0AA40AMH6_9PEZI|nr:glycosyl hydrolase family 76-domain-containing protein [Lasiosphaeria miniovina]KAK0718585.1 glycosyl hydrolase family 76-domain-containing protein [Lasiosphaeria miniovina]
MPPNWTASLGNDDQGFWGMSAMLAAETNFQNPPAGQPQWLALAQAVFNTQAERWDTASCGGGLRWQIPLSNNGYDYKNTITAGIFFNIAARLARYTANATYADWAVRTWDWVEAVGYIDADYNIFDGGHVENNCTDINPAQFSYIAAIFVQGLGFMYNYTHGDDLWGNRLRGLTNHTLNYFFPSGIAVEAACELPNLVQCTTDMLSFKGYLHRFLAQTTQMAPFTRATILPVLRSSAQGMASACDAASGVCGFRWNTDKPDGLVGAGQQMNALGALVGQLLVLEETSATGADKAPLTNATGGTSVGNPAAGGNPSVDPVVLPITEKDRAGAGILTALVLVSMVAALLWMSSAANEGPNRWEQDQRAAEAAASARSSVMTRASMLAPPPGAATGIAMADVGAARKLEHERRSLPQGVA